MARPTIRRWHGWAAYCPDCQEPILLCGEYVTFAEKDDVRVALTDDGALGDNLPEIARDACGCWQRKTTANHA